MKRIFFSIWILTSVFLVKAQDAGVSPEWGGNIADSVRCWESYNIYGSLYQSQSYLEAFESWKVVYDLCPGAKKNTFIMAPKLLTEKINATADPAEKAKWVNLLLESYDKRLEYFPEKHGYVLGMQAVEIMKYFRDEPRKYYDAFQEALKYDDDGDLVSPAVINGLFISATRLLQAKDVELDEFFNVMNIVLESVETNNNQLNRDIAAVYAKVTRPDTLGGEDADPIVDSAALSREDNQALYRLTKTLEGYEKVESNVEKLLGDILSCSRLSRIYNQEAFDKYVDDPIWLRRAANMLSKERTNDAGEPEDCTDDPMYFMIAERLYELEPSANAARGMGRLSFKKEDYKKGLEFYKQAAELEADPKKKAGDYIKIALAYQKEGNLSSARTYANRAKNNRPDWGDPYLVLATVYADAAGTCGNNVFEKNAVYWLSIKELYSAISVDPSSSKKANALLSNYKKRLPDKGVSFTLDKKEGDTYRIGCWINETITVKFY